LQFLRVGVGGTHFDTNHEVAEGMKDVLENVFNDTINIAGAQITATDLSKYWKKLGNPRSLFGSWH
jgi:hypothetical protein